MDTLCDSTTCRLPVTVPCGTPIAYRKSTSVADPARGEEILRSGGVHWATGALNPAHLRFLGNYVDLFTIFGFFRFYSPFAVLHDRANPPFPLYHLGRSNTPWEQGPARYKDLTHLGNEAWRMYPLMRVNRGNIDFRFAIPAEYGIIFAS